MKKPLNPEAPFDDLDAHWHEPPPTSSGWWSMVVVFIAVVLIGIAVYCVFMTPAGT